MNQSKRIEWIDIAKGLGILAVILGHLKIPDILIRLIFSWHMPLFFIISGILFKDKNFVELLKSKFKSLIKPYLYTCLAMILFACLKNYLNNVNIEDAIIYWTKASLYGSGDKRLFGLPAIGALWFLLAMFWGIIFIHFCLKFKYPVLPISSLFALGYFTKDFWLPLSIQSGMVSVIYIYIGLILKEKNILPKLINVKSFILCLTIWIFGIYNGCGHLCMVCNYFELKQWDFLVSLVAVIMIFNISHYIKKFHFLSFPIQFAGKNSLKFLCFHILELNLFPWETFVHGNFIHKKIFLLKLIYVYSATFILNMLKKLKIQSKSPITPKM